MTITVENWPIDDFAVLARRWVRHTLRNDTELAEMVTTITEGAADPRATYPLVVYNIQSAFLPSGNEDQDVVLYANGTILVRVIGNNSDWDEISPISRRLLQLLAGRVNDPIPGGGWVLGTGLLRQLPGDAVDDYRVLGAEYRIRIQAY